MQIDNSKPVSPRTGVEVYRSQNLQPPKEAEKSIVQQSKADSDRIEISAEAQELLANQRLAANEANGSAPQADSAAALSRSLLSAGVVDDSDRAQKIAEKVMTKVDETEQAKQSRLEEIREKVDSNFYSSPQVTEKIAERLQDELNIR